MTLLTFPEAAKLVDSGIKLNPSAPQAARSLAGATPVGNRLLRGITDIAAALSGSQRMVFEFFDHPQPLEQPLVRCTEI